MQNFKGTARMLPKEIIPGKFKENAERVASLLRKKDEDELGSDKGQEISLQLDSCKRDDFI